MPFPQIQTAGLVTASTIVAQSASFTAANGSINNVTTGASAITCTLPPVAQGGPVIVRKVDAGTGAVTVKTSDGSQVDGIAGSTGRALAATQYTGAQFVSDGTNWWTITT